MKILFVNEYTLRRGGVDYLVDMEIDALRKKNCDVELFSVNHNELMKENDQYNYWGILKAVLLTKRKLQSFIDWIKPDIVHFHNIYPLMGAPIWKNLRKGDSKFILHLHNYYPFCINSFFFRQNKLCALCQEENEMKYGIINKCFNDSYFHSFASSIFKAKPRHWINLANQIDHFIGVSNFICDKYAEFGIERRKISCVYNFTQSLPNPESVIGDYVLYVGDIVDAKGIEIICETASRLPSIKFVIAGDGRDLVKYKTLYKNIENIDFIGYVKNENKTKLFTNCRFLFLPYLSWESFGLVILEAYNYGKPVITSGNGGSYEVVIDGKTGIILKNLEYDFVSSKVNQFWKLLDTRNPYFNDCIHYSSRFSIDIHIEKLLKIYNRLSVE